MPAATELGILEEAAELIKPARDDVIREAAQARVLHNDDTGVKVLALRRIEAEEAGDRTGVFASGVARAETRKSALFFTGRQHAGENLAEMLKRRAPELPVPIQMSVRCRATQPNRPSEPTSPLPNLWQEAVFAWSPEEHLRFHQYSQPVMDDLHQWLIAQTDGRQGICCYTGML